MKTVINEMVKAKKKLVQHGFVIADHFHCRYENEEGMFSSDTAFSLLIESPHKVISLYEPRAALVCEVSAFKTPVAISVFGGDMIPLAEKAGCILEEETGRPALVTLCGTKKKYEASYMETMP